MTDTDNLDIIFVTSKHLANRFCLETNGTCRSFHDKKVTVLAMLKGVED